jgi:hypothetical protein
MKSQLRSAEDLQQRRIEADLEAGLSALFRRCPTLCGFSVRDAASLARDGLAFAQASEIFVTEVSVFPCSSLEAPPEISREIARVLVKLIDECPEASELLCQRTFARVFH